MSEPGGGEGDAILPAILCGGSGTRLWPASRDAYPKQFLALVGPRSTYQETLLRVAGPDMVAGAYHRPLVIANHAVRFLAAEQAGLAGVPADLVIEPEGRDSAAAIAVAALWAERMSPHTPVLALAADHLVTDVPAFHAAIAAALPHARAGRIMTLGMRPDRPATGYGYIRPGEPLSAREYGEAMPAFAVARFIEKPDAESAATLVAEGCLWNSGNFLFRADAMIEELAAQAPAVLEAARAALDGATRDLDFTRLAAEAFRAAPRISIDYAVMEKTTRAGVVPAALGWSDVGTWDAVWSVSPRDADGNAVLGAVELDGCRDCLVVSEHALTAVVGLSDAVVVTTPDAVLVTSRADAARVKDLVASLKAKGRPEANEPPRVYAPWGWYQRMDSGDRFKVKRIQVKPGGRLSLQKHMHRAEHWVVVRGTAEVTVAGQTRLLGENESTYVPIGAEHRLANPGRIPLEIVEVQVGPYTGEDDIIRIEDIYGR